MLLRVGDLVLDRSRHEVKAADRVIDCTATEFKLLAILMERQGRVQGRDRLLTDVWGYDSVIDTRTVDTHMRRLRDKLGPHGSYIETTRGFGYRLATAGRSLSCANNLFPGQDNAGPFFGDSFDGRREVRRRACFG